MVWKQDLLFAGRRHGSWLTCAPMLCYIVCIINTLFFNVLSIWLKYFAAGVFANTIKLYFDIANNWFRKYILLLYHLLPPQKRKNSPPLPNLISTKAPLVRFLESVFFTSWRWQKLFFKYLFCQFRWVNGMSCKVGKVWCTAFSIQL